MEPPRDVGGYSLLFSANPMPMWVFDTETLRFLEVNEAAVAKYGFSRDEFLGMSIEEIRPAEDRPALDAELKAPRTTGMRGPGLWRHRRKDGTLLAVQITAQDMVFKERRARLVVAQEVGEGERLMAEVHEKERFLQSVLDGMPAVVFVKDLEGRFTLVNEAWERFTGVPRDQAIGKTAHHSFPVDVADRIRRDDVETFDANARTETEETLPGAQGVQTQLTSRFPLRDEEGRVRGLVGLALDITKRKRAEEALYGSELRYRRLFEAAKDGILILDADTAEIVDVNPFLCGLLGLSREEVLGRKLWEIGPFKDVPTSRINFRELQLAQYIRYDDLPLESAKGRKIDVEFVSNVYQVNGGRVIQCNVRDITERKKAAETQAVLSRAAEQSAESIMITDPQGSIIYVNPAFESSSGYSRAEAIGQNPRILKSGHQDAAFYGRMWNTLSRGEVWKGRLVNRRKDGALFQEDATIGPVRDAAGVLVNYVAVKRDVTNEMRLERQLMQAQKMEAVGRLAGGVAHDFNNLLGVIIGYGEMIRRKLHDEDPLAAKIDQILQAAERAAGLTRQLLAFSRKQVLQPRIVDLNGLVSELERMLGRLIGEDVKLETSLAADLGSVRVDPGQIEQVLMNLAVNARDAMPDGGRLTIETRNVDLGPDDAARRPPTRVGPYVMLAVSDSGMGMDAATQAHLFEPFFTTKEMGRGTGLGLSTVYGIVKQSEGFIWCYSEVGVGTTFKVYLPRVDEKASPRGKPSVAPLARGSETVLLIEDDGALRDLLCETLESGGYTVLVADGGARALQMAEEYPGAIELIVTDVIMPGPSGRQATEQIKLARSEVEILFISGYTDEAIARHGVLEPGAQFLSKPFTPESLLRKVREVLERR